MAKYTEFKLSTGAIVQVESTRTAPAVASLGPVDASASDKAWKDGAALVAEVGAEVVEAMRKVFSKADEVSVEFGASISGKTGVILVEGSATANLKVVVKWKTPGGNG